jgi:hypothetical protein
MTIQTEYETEGMKGQLVKLDRIFQELLDIRHRLDDIERMFSNWRPQPLRVSESGLLSLPDNLRKTYLIVASEGECSATHVSALTGRSRAIESSYLNQLVRMGWLTKRRSSKTLQFQAFSDSNEEPRLVQTSEFLPARERIKGANG